MNIGAVAASLAAMLAAMARHGRCMSRRFSVAWLVIKPETLSRPTTQIAPQIRGARRPPAAKGDAQHTIAQGPRTGASGRARRSEERRLGKTGGRTSRNWWTTAN